MQPHNRNGDQFIRCLFIFIAVLIPALTALGVYLQASMPAVDCTLDWQTGVVLDVPPDSFANYAGLMPGDVILSVDGIPLTNWKSIETGNRAATIKRGDQSLTLELPILPFARVNLPALLNAIAVALTFWGIGTLLLWRRFQDQVARLFFLLTQSIGIGLLFFLAYPQLSIRPDWMAVLSIVGFHLAGALLVHFYLTFPVVLGSPRQRHLILIPTYGLMLVALAFRMSATELGLRLSFLYNTAEIIGAVGILIYCYLRRATPDGKRRLRLVVFGGIASTVPNFLFYLLPTIAGAASRMPGWMVGPLLILSPASYLLAIVRHHLFDIDRLLNRALVYATLSFGILLLYLGPFLLIYRFLPGDWLAQVFIVAAVTLLVGLSFDWTRAGVQRWVDRFFYGGWYDYPGVVETISAALARTIERAQLTEVLTRQVPRLMQLHEGRVVEWSDSRVVKPLDDATMRLADYPSPVALHFPLTFQGETRAVWHVGAHRDGEDFTTADRRILSTITRQAETALGNVLLVETLRRQLDEIRASRETLTQAQRQLLRSREEERTRLARELHDGPIQDLVGLNMQLGLLLTDGESPLAETLTAMRAEVRGLLTDLRQLCAELRPPMLDTIGLGAALRVLADEWTSQSSVPVTLDLPADATLRILSSEIGVNLYRLVQEALTNVAHHADAQSVTIRLTWQDSRLTLTIRDDGRGFVVPSALHELAAQGHFGLVGMQERVSLIGGTCTVESAPGAGTTVRVVWSDSRVAG
jgi:signal transduction histidine kinase